MKRAWVAFAVIVCVGCKDKAKQAPPPGAGSGSAAAVVEDKPRTAIDGPSITPIVTNSITFFVPKDAPWWGEMAFGCYAGAITLQPGNKPSDAFTKISPAVEPALRTAYIDLDKDVGAIGAWGCGDGACIYLALALRSPDKLRDMLAQIIPGQQPKELGKHHWSIEAPGAQGPRVIQLRAVPIAWPAKLPTDSWSRDAARATHVVLLTGMFDKSTQVDGLAAAADAKTGAARVADVEAVVADARGRCVLGYVNKRPFQPGYTLDKARFVLAAPEGKSDALTRMLGSLRTLDLEVELVLDPAPTPKVVQGWIAEARAWVANIGASVRGGFADQGAVVDAMFDMAALLGKSGFKHTLKDKALTLSFRTDRISQAELMTIETRLQAAIGGAP
jgi:hypothetical protein